MAEAGLPGFVVYTWYGLLGPQGMPREVVDKLHTILSKAMALPENRKRFEAQGLDAVGGSSDELAKLMKDEIGRWAQVVKVSGAKAD
jgi:tripartite-type tricarboxylate transporter receptor subunit TctC